MFTSLQRLKNRYFMKYFDYSFTSNDWEFGLGFNLPCRSKRSTFGFKVKHFFGLRLFLGPLTLELGREKEYYVGEDDDPRYITEEEAGRLYKANQFNDIMGEEG